MFSSLSATALYDKYLKKSYSKLCKFVLCYQNNNKILQIQIIATSKWKT